MNKNKKLVKVYMVGTSKDVFGSEIIKDVVISFTGPSRLDKESYLIFKGRSFFNTKKEAMEFIKQKIFHEHEAYVIHEIYLWRKLNEIN